MTLYIGIKCIEQINKNAEFLFFKSSKKQNEASIVDTITAHTIIFISYEDMKLYYDMYMYA